jgi:hypothetical protein
VGYLVLVEVLSLAAVLVQALAPVQDEEVVVLAEEWALVQALVWAEGHQAPSEE